LAAARILAGTYGKMRVRRWDSSGYDYIARRHQNEALPDFLWVVLRRFWERRSCFPPRGPLGPARAARQKTLRLKGSERSAAIGLALVERFWPLGRPSPDFGAAQGPETRLPTLNLEEPNSCWFYESVFLGDLRDLAVIQMSRPSCSRFRDFAIDPRLHACRSWRPGGSTVSCLRFDADRFEEAEGFFSCLVVGEEVVPVGVEAEEGVEGFGEDESEVGLG